MPYYKCAICKNKVTYTKPDNSFHEKNYWECPLCYSVIAKKRYKVNIKNGVTVFSAMGSALGDKIVMEVVKRRYILDNPDEFVIFADESMDVLRKIDRYKPQKIFWSDVTNMMSPPKEARWFSLCNEANEFARQGYYPIFTERYEKVDIKVRDFVVFHIRNINKTPAKNEKIDIVTEVLNFFDKLKLTVVLVGNDEVLSDEGSRQNVMDYRKKLTLGQIAWLCEKSLLFVGKDSGLAHLAGCTSAPLVVWDFASPRWYPKTPNPVITIMRQDTNVDNILHAINRIL